MAPSEEPPQTAAPRGHGHGHAAAVYEEAHVHGVYEAIAPHFSATRHTPWPFVAAFLAAQPAGSVGLDVGCGNGKNMAVNGAVLLLGCDRSPALVALAAARRTRQQQQQQQQHTGAAAAAVDVAVADGLQLPFRPASADFAICIAVVHHLSTRERRVDAIRQLLRCLRRDKADAAAAAAAAAELPLAAGGVLLYVWALEQGSSRRGWDQGSEQDLLVPWVVQAPQQKKPKDRPQPPGCREKKKPKQKKQKQQQQQQQQQQQGPQPAAADPRQEDDTANDATTTTTTRRGDRDGGRAPSGGEGGQGMQGHPQQSHGRQGGGREEGGAATATAAAAGGGGERVAAGVVADAGAAAARSSPAPCDDGGGGAGGSAGSAGQPQPHTDEDTTFHRFYHLYRAGELEEDVLAAGGRVLRSGYERDNWWAIAA